MTEYIVEEGKENVIMRAATLIERREFCYKDSKAELENEIQAKIETLIANSATYYFDVSITEERKRAALAVLDVMMDNRDLLRLLRHKPELFIEDGIYKDEYECEEAAEFSEAQIEACAIVAAELLGY